MEERKDKDLGSIFNAKSLLAGQGISKRLTAQSSKVAVDFAEMLSKDVPPEKVKKPSSKVEETPATEMESAIGFGLRLTVRQMDKAGTSEGAKLGWETRRGAASISDGPKEFGQFMRDAIAQRDTPEAKETKEVAENLAISDVPLKDAFNAAQKRVDQAEALAQETFKRYGPALSKYHMDNINREREEIKRSMVVADGHVRENSRGYAADAISNAVEGADLMSIWVSSAVNDVWRERIEGKAVKKSGTSEGAKLGWESRRGGGAEEGGKWEPPKAFEPVEGKPGTFRMQMLRPGWKAEVSESKVEGKKYYSLAIMDERSGRRWDLATTKDPSGILSGARITSGASSGRRGQMYASDEDWERYLDEQQEIGPREHPKTLKGSFLTEGESQ